MAIRFIVYQLIAVRSIMTKSTPAGSTKLRQPDSRHGKITRLMVSYKDHGQLQGPQRDKSTRPKVSYENYSELRGPPHATRPTPCYKTHVDHIHGDQIYEASVARPTCLWRPDSLYHNGQIHEDQINEVTIVGATRPDTQGQTQQLDPL